MHRFTLGDYLLQITKERMLADYFKEKDVANASGKVVELVTLSSLGALAQTFRSYFKDRQ